MSKLNINKGIYPKTFCSIFFSFFHFHICRFSFLQNLIFVYCAGYTVDVKYDLQVVLSMPYHQEFDEPESPGYLEVANELKNQVS